MRTKRYSIVTGLVLILSLLASSLLIPGSANAATDKVKPTISGATNSVAYLNHSFDPRKGVTAKDNVDGNITSIIKISGKVNTKKLGKYTLTYKVTDSAKNTCTVKRVITVKKDTTKPKISGATNKTVYMGYSFNPKAGVKATDNAAGNLTSQIKVSGKVNTNKVGKYKVTYTVTDKARNTSKITRTITVKKDTTKPKITGASNKTVYKGYSFNPKTGVTASDNVDGNITSKIKISGKLNVNEVGIYKLTYTVEDKTKNKTTVTRTITVKKDTIKPKITGAGNTTVNYDDSFIDAFDPKKGVKATDNVDGTITNQMKITGTVNTMKIGTYKLTYTVKDKTGNQTSVTRIVKVVDKVSPKITGASNTTINYGSSFDPMKGIKATDYIDGTITDRVTITGTVNTDKIGTYKLTYTVKDKSGNQASVTRTVNVVDKVSPKITGVSNTSINYGTTFDPMNGVIATDYIDGTITNRVTVTGAVDTDKIGTYKLTYTVKDKSGNKATVTRTVKVVDKFPPKILGANDMSINYKTWFDPMSGIEAIDEIDGTITNLVTFSGISDIDIANGLMMGTYKLTYSVSDKSGNRTTVTRTVNVVDMSSPVLTGVGDTTINIGEAFSPLSGVKASDEIDGDLTAGINVEGKVNVDKPGTYLLTYTVKDKSGNIATAERKVTVVDNIFPEISVIDTDIELQWFDSFDPMQGVTATDNYDGDLTSKINVEGKIDTSLAPDEASFLFTYTVKDTSGNITEAQRSLYLIPRSASLKGLDDLKIYPGESFDPLEGVLATDYKSGEDITSYIKVEHNVDVNKIGTYEIRYSFPSDKGYRNDYEYIRKVIVVDNIPPVISGVKDVEIYQYSASLGVLRDEVTAQDNLDGDMTSVVEIEHNVDTSRAGDYIVIYKVTDSAGNTTVERCTLTVKPLPESFKIHTDLPSPIAKTGQEFTLTAIVTPNEESYLKDINWWSSDETIATIDQNGAVKVLKEGTVTFWARIGETMDAYLTIVVIDKPGLLFTGYSEYPNYIDIWFLNQDIENIEVRGVKFYNKDGSLVRTYSKDELKSIGVKTDILPSKQWSMRFDYSEEEKSVLSGGKFVLLAGLKDEITYEYSVDIW
ncbi:immunoglobulin-like domain-containing protein [Bacillus sp. FJAT-27916]|uniref:immunoglobulin-like domain-containing protein n=1 Tax=Bacillus sp. FJAT-27916 TaxID=1679169 RepID=UPI000670EFD5|nr:immunoglobulin-like domain-containing protein [Bacillus sp. FJAT-27916]